MTDLDILRELASDHRDWVSKRAEMAVMISEQYEGGGLESEEYMDRMLDLIRSDRLDSEANDLETKAVLVTAVMGAAQVI